MTTVTASATVSLDGFIADDTDAVGPLFDWYGNGDVPFNGGDPQRVFHVSAASAAHLRDTWSRIGVAVIGRRLFDLTNGWNGRPAVGDHVFVVTHRAPTDWPFPDAPFTFVTDGLESAIARAKGAAGGRDVSLTGGDLLGQALSAGLVDELRVDLVPVVFGRGVRLFGAFAGPPALLGDPEIVAGDRVTHLRYAVHTR
ncbi:dihydrofolate reductase family protein [Virgisporangium ochraceum]|uniref:Deaminase n=1 Tax=Virgisporangium ochraceum TaxID=65505 RepID=A0A8J4EG73_9ACTN|nr:dihydrofolate reductase family protein [Virgisporangium ochraceum]GIJ73451.1 deaminase [Virgisporangium ochraceum]